MEFKARAGNTFVMNVCLIVLSLLMAVFCFLKFKEGLLEYLALAWVVIAFVRTRTYAKYFYLYLKNKPVFAVTENHIEDFANGIKYYWCDIQEIYNENAYLYIKLNNPTDYINKIRPVNRFFLEAVSNTYNTPFIVNMDMIKVSETALLGILDEYSIKAASSENNLSDRVIS